MTLTPTTIDQEIESILDRIVSHTNADTLHEVSKDGLNNYDKAFDTLKQLLRQVTDEVIGQSKDYSTIIHVDDLLAEQRQHRDELLGKEQ